MTSAHKLNYFYNQQRVGATHIE